VGRKKIKERTTASQGIKADHSHQIVVCPGRKGVKKIGKMVLERKAEKREFGSGNLVQRQTP